MDTVTELADRGRSLSPEERVRLLDLLLDSLHQPPTDDVGRRWQEEIERRVARHERGEGKLHELSDVMDDAARIAP